MSSQDAATIERGLTGLPPIPAMTTDAERECYYRLAKEAAEHGAVVELGAWLGASTAYIAAGMRDSGVGAAVHVYDQFQSKTGHIEKVRKFYAKHNIDKAPVGPCLSAFQDNLGPLMDHVIAHPGRIENLSWGDSKISLLVSDAPKRVPAISSVLAKFQQALQPGSIMAWQDFCHFPSYEISACLYRLRDRLEFVEAVVPGTTLVFRVKSQWTLDEVSLDALALSRWTPQEIADAWYFWLGFVPETKKGLFQCGRALFLCDIGHPDEAVSVLGGVLAHHHDEVIEKWRYLKTARPDFVKRYAPLFELLDL